MDESTPGTFPCTFSHIKRVEKLRPVPAAEDIGFGMTITDHMMQIDWSKKDGWGKAEIIPYGPMTIEPSAMVFHYAPEVFEGMKAYKHADDSIHLFRPIENAKRLRRSAKYLSLPEIDPDAFVELLKQFVAMESRWIYKLRGYSLYLRPTLIATEPTLGVHIPKAARLFVIACPVSSYSSPNTKMGLYTPVGKYRAYPGGIGDVKAGANYGPTLITLQEAQKYNCQQVLWLSSENDNISEVGTMNCFVYWKNVKREKELITPPLDGTILPGIVRESLIALAKETFNEKIKISENHFTIHDLFNAHKEGRLIEFFGSGTAAIVCPVDFIVYKDQKIEISSVSEHEPIGRILRNKLLDIQHGESKEKPEWMVRCMGESKEKPEWMVDVDTR